MWEKIKERWQAWLVQIGKKRRQAYLEKKRRQLRNPAPTIIANDCVGGMVYHDLGLEFTSPTVNLVIRANDYFKFLSRLEAYLQCEVEEIIDPQCNYPVGELRLADESVRIYFMHYKTFQEAKEKWEKRCKRVDMNNLFVVFHNQKYISPRSHEYQQFRKLPYKNKVMLTFPVGVIDRDICPFFSWRLKNKPGRLLQYPHLFSKKRYIHRFDFVKFFNRGY